MFVIPPIAAHPPVAPILSPGRAEYLNACASGRSWPTPCRLGPLGNVDTSYDGRAREERLECPCDVRKIRNPHEITRLVETDQVSHPGQNGHVGDGVDIAHDPG